jgi:hypothetical protein
VKCRLIELDFSASGHDDVEWMDRFLKYGLSKGTEIIAQLGIYELGDSHVPGTCVVVTISSSGRLDVHELRRSRHR